MEIKTYNDFVKTAQEVLSHKKGDPYVILWKPKALEFIKSKYGEDAYKDCNEKLNHKYVIASLATDFEKDFQEHVLWVLEYLKLKEE